MEDDLWENVISAVCETDSYLKSRESDIKSIISLISNEISEHSESEDYGDILRDFLTRSSITEVGGLRDTAEVNYSHIVAKLHANVVASMAARHKEWKFKGRKVTNCGGFNIFPNKIHLQSKLSPHDLNNGRITMRLEIPSQVDVNNYPNIAGILDLGYSESIRNPDFLKLIDDFDQIIKPFLNKEWFKGQTLRSRVRDQWHVNGKWKNPKAILLNTTFYFTLPTVAGFEQMEVVKAMTDIHEAVWNLHLGAKKLK